MCVEGQRGVCEVEDGGRWCAQSEELGSGRSAEEKKSFGPYKVTLLQAGTQGSHSLHRYERLAVGAGGWGVYELFTLWEGHRRMGLG